MAFDGRMDVIDQQVFAGNSVRRLLFHPVGEIDHRCAALLRHFDDGLANRRQRPQRAYVLVQRSLIGDFGVRMAAKTFENLPTHVMCIGKPIVD